jgi:hypothetical protein
MIRAGAPVLALILAANVFPQDVGPGATNGKPDHANLPKSKSERSNVKAPVIDADVRSLLDETEALPPEFASDVFLRLVENGLIRNDGLKAKLLSLAFQKASAAHDDVMLRPWGVNVEETPQGLHAIASTVTRLDRISLQTRVARELFSISPRRAREVFESMPPHASSQSRAVKTGTLFQIPITTSSGCWSSMVFLLVRSRAVFEPGM